MHACFDEMGARAHLSPLLRLRAKVTTSTRP